VAVAYRIIDFIFKKSLFVVCHLSPSWKEEEEKSSRPGKEAAVQEAKTWQ